MNISRKILEVKHTMGAKPYNSAAKIKAELQNDSFCRENQYTTPSEAKQLCIESLGKNNPVERVIIYDELTNKVIFNRTGSDMACPVDVNLINSNENFSNLIHGHASILCDDGKEYTPPLNINDFRVFNSSKLKTITAVNVLGQECSLTKLEGFKPLTTKEMKKLEQAIFKTLFATLPSETVKTIQDNKNDSGMVNFAFKLAENQQKTREGMEALDSFWQNNAKKYNLKYSSNFNFCN